MKTSKSSGGYKQLKITGIRFGHLTTSGPRQINVLNVLRVSIIIFCRITTEYICRIINRRQNSLRCTDPTTIRYRKPGRRSGHYFPGRKAVNQRREYVSRFSGNRTGAEWCDNIEKNGYFCRRPVAFHTGRNIIGPTVKTGETARKSRRPDRV